VLKPAPWLAALMIAALAALSFAPFAFIHPTRVPRWRVVNLGALALWASLALWAVLRGLDPPPPVKAALAALAIYFCVARFWRTAD
jgi:phosphatidylcholine synthase